MFYSVDSSKYDYYLKEMQKFRTIRFLIILIIVTTVIYFSYSRSHHTPIWVLLLTTVVLCGAYFRGQRRWTAELNKFKDAKYELTSDVVKMYRGMEPPRLIKLSDIIVLDKTKVGTLLIIGNRWTKFNYYRPKRSGEPIDSQDRIFIPSVTNGYKDLIKQIKNACQSRSSVFL